jgi:biopolymer transport protein ExbB
MDPAMTATAVQAVATPVGGPAATLSVMDLIHQGWYATYPLIVASVIMISIVVERMWTLGRVGAAIERLTEQVCGLLAKGSLAEASKVLQQRGTPASRIYAPLLPLIRKGDVEEILEFGERRRLDENRIFRRNIWVLGTIGASAPFIGLFGTVVGIIKSFHQMAVMGTGGFSVVAAGISEALVATALGLVVAIIAVIFYNYLQVKVGNLDTQLRVGLGRVLESAEIGGVHGAQ